MNPVINGNDVDELRASQAAVKNDQGMTRSDTGSCSKPRESPKSS